jgi:hypothetical protein
VAGAATLPPPWAGPGGLAMSQPPVCPEGMAAHPSPTPLAYLRCQACGRGWFGECPPAAVCPACAGPVVDAPSPAWFPHPEEDCA